MMIINGTTRTVTNSRTLPSWLSKPFGSLMVRPVCEWSAPEVEPLDALPGNVDLSHRAQASNDQRAEIHVIRLQPGPVGEDRGRARAEMSVGEVRRKRTVLHQLSREGQGGDAGDWHLRGHAATVQGDLAGLS